MIDLNLNSVVCVPCIAYYFILMFRENQSLQGRRDNFRIRTCFYLKHGIKKWTDLLKSTSPSHLSRNACNSLSTHTFIMGDIWKSSFSQVNHCRRLHWDRKRGSLALSVKGICIRHRTSCALVSYFFHFDSAKCRRNCVSDPFPGVIFSPHDNIVILWNKGDWNGILQSV